MRQTQRTRPDRQTVSADYSALVLDYTVGLCAVILSWAAWTGLAKMCGHTQTVDIFGLFTFRLSWITAIVVDFLAVRSFRSWLRAGPWVSPHTRRFAAIYSLVYVGIAIGGNVVYHVLDYYKATPNLWIIIPVSALAPLGIGMLSHLRALERRDRTLWESGYSETEQTQQSRTDTIARRLTRLAHARIETAVSQAESRESARSQTLQTLPQSPETVETETVKDETDSYPVVRSPRIASVSSLIDQSKTHASHLETVKARYPDWDKRPKPLSYDEIGEATGLTGRETIKNIRKALIAEADSLSTQERELVNVG